MANRLAGAIMAYCQTCKRNTAIEYGKKYTAKDGSQCVLGKCHKCYNPVQKTLPEIKELL